MDGKGIRRRTKVKKMLMRRKKKKKVMKCNMNVNNKKDIIFTKIIEGTEEKKDIGNYKYIKFHSVYYSVSSFFKGTFNIN